MDDLTEQNLSIDRGRQLKETDPQGALEVFQRAKESAEKRNDIQTVGDCLFESGQCRYYLAHYAAAQSDYSTAGSIFHDLGDLAKEAACVDGVGACMGEMGDNAAALEKALDALTLWQSVDQPAGTARCLSNIGNRYYYFGQFDLALDYYQRSLTLREAVRDVSGTASVYNNLAIIYQHLGEYDRAMEYYNRSIQLHEEVGSPINLANALLNLASVTLESLANPEETQAMLTRALSLVRGRNKTIEACCLQGLGAVFHELGDYAAAIDRHLAAIECMTEIGNSQLLAQFYISLAESQSANHDPDATRKSLEQALVLAEGVNALEEMCQAHARLSEVCEQTLDFTAALIHLKESHRLREHILSAETELKVKGLLIKSEVEKTRREAEIYKIKNQELSETEKKLKIALEKNRELLDELKLTADDLLRQSWEDPLTHVYNRRFFEIRFREESERARRFGHDFTLALLDLDKFKIINDRYSHLIGDEVLRVFADILHSVLRSVDVVTRYGGDEFVLLLVETNLAQAASVIARIQNAVEKFNWVSIQPELMIRFSAGLCSFNGLPNGEDPLEIADANLYKAKSKDKGQGTWYEPA